VSGNDSTDTDTTGTDTTDARGGYGLLGLRERVRAHGGQLTVRARDDGYVVDARIPLGRDAGAGAPAHSTTAVAASTVDDATSPT
jgi:signal transduction histidine kinase